MLGVGVYLESLGVTELLISVVTYIGSIKTLIII
jgi:hypothetical protein